jgi:hypothetical protein
MGPTRSWWPSCCSRTPTRRWPRKLRLLKDRDTLTDTDKALAAGLLLLKDPDKATH